MKYVFTIASILITCCINHVISEPCDLSLAAEGDSYTFKKRIPANQLTRSQALRWTREEEGYILKNRTILECGIGRSDNKSCEMTDGDHHHRYSGHLIHRADGQYYEAIVQIASVDRARDERTWWWGIEDKVLGSCELKAYSFRKSPQCFAVKTSGSVKMTCEVNGVYPEIRCQFSYEKASTQGHSIPDKYITIKKRRDQKGTDVQYYDYTCKLDLPFDQLIGAGSYDFKMKTSMDLSSLECNETIHKSASRTHSFVLPEAKLMGCSNTGNIKGKSGTCQCGLRVEGEPPGAPSWSHRNRGAGDSERGVADTLHVTYNSSDPDKTYTCEGISDLGQGASANYTPRFAFGPTQISISVHELQTNVSHGSKPTLRPFYVFCNVSINNVNPEPTVKVLVGSVISDAPETTETSGDHYRHRFRIVPRQTGFQKVTCQASNPIFGELHTKKTKEIEIFDDGSIEVSEPDGSDENSGSKDKDSSDSSEDGDKDNTSSDGEDGGSDLSTAGGVGIGLAAVCVVCIPGAFIFYKVRTRIRGSWERRRTLPNLAHHRPSTAQPPATHTRIGSHHPHQGGIRTVPHNSHQNDILQDLPSGGVGTSTMTSFSGSPTEEEHYYAELDDVLSEDMSSNQSNYDNQNNEFHPYEVAVPYSSDANPDPGTPRIVNNDTYITMIDNLTYFSEPVTT